MTQQATVRAVMADGTVRIAVHRHAACASDCAGCAGCAHPEQAVEVMAHNAAGAQAGDRVVVESGTAYVLGLAGLLYLMPVALMVAGYFLIPGGETARTLGALAGLAAGLALCRMVSRRLARRAGTAFRIVAIDKRP